MYCYVKIQMIGLQIMTTMMIHKRWFVRFGDCYYGTCLNCVDGSFDGLKSLNGWKMEYKMVKKNFTNSTQTPNMYKHVLHHVDE